MLIEEVESEFSYLPLSNYQYYLIETAMMEERRCTYRYFGVISLHRCQILTGRNIATAWEFVKGNSYFSSQRK